MRSTPVLDCGQLEGGRKCPCLVVRGELKFQYRLLARDGHGHQRRIFLSPHHQAEFHQNPTPQPTAILISTTYIEDTTSQRHPVACACPTNSTHTSALESTLAATRVQSPILHQHPDAYTRIKRPLLDKRTPHPYSPFICTRLTALYLSVTLRPILPSTERALATPTIDSFGLRALICARSHPNQTANMGTAQATQVQELWSGCSLTKIEQLPRRRRGRS